MKNYEIFFGQVTTTKVIGIELSDFLGKNLVLIVLGQKMNPKLV